MDFLRIIAVAVALGMDAMSVSMAVGVRWHGPRQRFRLAWHMGLFQFMMPVIGWLVGKQLAGVMQQWGKYVAAVLVIGIGAKMLWEVLKSHPGAVAESIESAEENVRARTTGKKGDPTKGLSLVVLAVATSIDALVVGFSLGLREANIWTASVIIGLVAAAMSLAGVSIGRRIGESLGAKAELIGAVVLIGLGVSFVWW